MLKLEMNAGYWTRSWHSYVENITVCTKVSVKDFLHVAKS